MKYTHADEGIYVSVPETQKLVFERPEIMSDRQQWNEAASKFCAEMNREATAIYPEEQVLSVANPETWGVGDVVRLREDSDGSDSAYWHVGPGYLITEKTDHGTLFVTQDKGDPIEISMGIARRWFRLERKRHKRSLGFSIREFFYGSQPPSLRDVSCGIYDVSEEVTTKSYVDGDGNKFTEKTYELTPGPLTEQYYRCAIEELEDTVRNLRQELKERKEEAEKKRIIDISREHLVLFAGFGNGSLLDLGEEKIAIRLT